MKYKITLNREDIYYMDWRYEEQIFDYACKQLEQRNIYLKSINRFDGIFEVYVECDQKPQFSDFKYSDIFKIEAIN